MEENNLLGIWEDENNQVIFMEKHQFDWNFQFNKSPKISRCLAQGTWKLQKTGKSVIMKIQLVSGDITLPSQLTVYLQTNSDSKMQLSLSIYTLQKVPTASVLYKLKEDSSTNNIVDYVENLDENQLKMLSSTNKMLSPRDNDEANKSSYRNSMTLSENIPKKIQRSLEERLSIRFHLLDFFNKFTEVNDFTFNALEQLSSQQPKTASPDIRSNDDNNNPSASKKVLSSDDLSEPKTPTSKLQLKPVAVGFNNQKCSIYLYIHKLFLYTNNNNMFF